MATADLLERRAPVAPVIAPMRPVRVCFLIDELTRAGTETQLLRLIDRLDRRRVEPYLCLLRGDSAVSRSLEPECCSVLRLGVGSLARPSCLASAWRFVRFLRRERIDVLQAYFPESTYFGVPLARLAGVRFVLRTRNNLGYWMTPWHRRLGRFCTALSDGLIANCAASRDAVVADEGLDRARVVVLENGVDLERFSETDHPHNVGQGRRVGVTANLRPVKGLDVFLEAAAIVGRCRPDVTFTVAGEGPLRSALATQAERLGVRLELPGTVGNISGFLAGLDLAVLPSLSEGMSNALLEYMAAGRAIVATAVGGNTTLIEEGVNGLLVPPNDPGRLAEAIGHLLDNPDLAAWLGRAARRRVEERYSREVMVRRFEDLYTGLMRGTCLGR